MFEISFLGTPGVDYLFYRFKVEENFVCYKEIYLYKKHQKRRRVSPMQIFDLESFLTIKTKQRRHPVWFPRN